MNGMNSLINIGKHTNPTPMHNSNPEIVHQVKDLSKTQSLNPFTAVPVPVPLLNEVNVAIELAELRVM